MNINDSHRKRVIFFDYQFKREEISRTFVRYHSTHPRINKEENYHLLDDFDDVDDVE